MSFSKVSRFALFTEKYSTATFHFFENLHSARKNGVDWLSLKSKDSLKSILSLGLEPSAPNLITLLGMNTPASTRNLSLRIGFVSSSWE